jgi:hypothetical protein
MGNGEENIKDIYFSYVPIMLILLQVTSSDCQYFIATFWMLSMN